MTRLPHHYLKGLSVSFDKPIIPDRTEQPFIGLTQEWFFDNSIVLYRLTAISSEIVENWATLVLETIEAWDTQKPYLALHDLSQPGVSLQYAAITNFDLMNIGITMTGRMQAEKFFDQHVSLKARIAVNFNLSLSGQTNRTLMNYLNRYHSSIRYKTFYSRDKAFLWLNGDVQDTAELKQLIDD